MSLFEIEEATEIIHEAAGEEANVILGAVIDENMTDEMMVTVIATGFNQREGGVQTVIPVAQPKTVRLVEKIPTGVEALQEYDTPAYVRRGIDLQVRAGREVVPEREKIDKHDPEKPAFLRKIMD